MKAKHLMTMVALPALFAACAQEELVESTAVGLEGRALLDPNFSINVVGEGVDSRFSWNEDNFGWNAFTANDKFSAGLVDNLIGGVQNKVLTNYVFSSANGGSSYTTTSQMVEGAYFFYSYPGFETSEKAEAVAFDLTSQTKVDLNDAAATVNANQLFVSPIYKLSAGHANIELPLYFVSYWSTAAVKIKNTTGESFKIRRITLSDVNDKFVVKGTITPTKFGNNLTYTWSDDAEEYVLPEDKTNAGLLTADIATAAASGTQEVITVDCQAYELANGADVTAYIQVPAGVHDDGDVTVQVTVETVNASGATILKNIEFPMVYNADGADADTENDYVAFKRGYTIPAYGAENGEVKAFEIDKIKLTGAEPSDGVYADSYEALEEALLGATGEVEINNLGALQLDDDVMYLLSNLRSGAKAKFLNAIEITSISNGTVKNATFAEGAEIVAGNITISNNVTVVSGKTLTIAADAAAKIADGTFTSATIANNGTLTLAVTTVPTIINGANSTMIIDANVTLATASVNAPKYLTINTGKTLTANVFTIAYGQTVTNNGTIAASNASDFTINGTVDNHGTITNGTLAGTESSSEVAQPAVINNYGVITTITGDNSDATAKIVQKSATAEIQATLGTGEIDNTNNGFVTSPSFEVYASYEGDQTGKLGDLMAVTKVYLKNGTWTNPELASGVASLDLNTVTLTADEAITLPPTLTTLSMKSSTVSKDLIMNGVVNATLEGSTFNAPVSMTSLATLNLKAMTINYALTTAANTAATIQGGADANNVKTTTIAASVIQSTSLTALTIDANAKLVVTSNGSLGTVGTTTVTNDGTVENKGVIGGAAHPATGTWKGNNVKIS